MLTHTHILTYIHIYIHTHKFSYEPNLFQISDSNVMVELMIVLVSLPSRPVYPESESFQRHEREHDGQIIYRYTLHYKRDNHVDKYFRIEFCF